MSDGLTRIEQEEILNRIEDQFNQGSNELDDEDHYLLEVDFETLWEKRGSPKNYWLHVIESARRVAWMDTTNAGPQDEDKLPC